VCGIAGMLTDRGADERARLDRMVDAQSHRGPDDSGSLCCNKAGRSDRVWSLGHRRLSIIDLTSAGHQPMVDPRTGNAIVYNGEIYNFQQLRAELTDAGFNFRSRTDTEVVLLGYAHWGEHVVEHLRGMFAFAIWDAREELVLLARDRLGEKPVYYCTRPVVPGIHFAFASELRALLESGLTSRTIDRVGLQTFITNGFVVGPCTIVEGVNLLEPGTVMRVRADGVATSRRFWHVPMDSDPVDADGSEHLASLGDQLSSAVGSQLVSDVPLGAFLSGGIDSSVVVGLASRHAASPLRTFTLVFEESEFSESQYADAVASAFHTEHQEVMLTRAEFQENVATAIDALDQPSFDGANTFFVSRAARAVGLTVALAGTGGDELFGGYNSFAQLQKLRWMLRAAGVVPSRVRRSLSRAALWADALRRGGYPSQTSMGKGAVLLGERPDLVGIYQTLYRIFLQDTVADLIADCDETTAPDGLTPQAAEYLRQQIGDRTDLAAWSFLELHGFLGNRLLRDTDSVSMAVSLEVRLPLIDYRVIEAATRLDAASRFEPLGSKRSLIRASGLALPDVVLNRKKVGFVLPIEVWLRQSLAREATDILTDPGLCRRAGLQREPIQRLWQQFLRGDKGLYWTRLWAIYVLLRWCEARNVHV